MRMDAGARRGASIGTLGERATRPSGNMGGLTLAEGEKTHVAQNERWGRHWSFR